jgi:phospholipid/cholesterol/gamma-HCH transport system permease protein
MSGEQRPPRRPSPAPSTSGIGDFLTETFPSATSEPDATGPIPRVGVGPTESLNPPTSPAIVAPQVASQWVAPDYRKRTTGGDRFAAALPRTARTSLEAIGGLYSMMAASLYGLGSDLVRRKFQFNEFVERAWFLVSVALLPAILVSIPLGVAIALQVGALAAQIGATSFVGAADAIGVLREASPIVTALLLAGVGGSAVCAELGARTIREEIDAMIVLGLNPLRRLVAPLMVAGVMVSVFLNFVVIFVSISSAYIFDLAALHGTSGSFFGSFTQFATVADFVTSEIKAAVFGLVAVMIAAFQGLNAKRGPTGVGEAVNQSVVITGIVLFALNLVITEVFFAVVPQRTF